MSFDTKQYLLDGDPMSARELIHAAASVSLSFRNDDLQSTSEAARILRAHGHGRAQQSERINTKTQRIMHTDEKTKLFDVVIYEKATRKIDTIIGTKLRRFDGVGHGYNTAELRQQTGRERVNEDYDVAIVDADKFSAGDVLP